MRLTKILYGLEYVFDGLLCDHIVFSNWDGKKFDVLIRKWHPSYWIGYVRCVLLGDKCGSAWYTDRYKELQ